MSRTRELLKTVKTGEPVLKLDRGVAAETLWPATLEEEADKAASILRSFGEMSSACEIMSSYFASSQ